MTKQEDRRRAIIAAAEAASAAKKAAAKTTGQTTKEVVAPAAKVASAPAAKAPVAPATSTPVAPALKPGSAISAKPVAAPAEPVQAPVQPARTRPARERSAALVPWWERPGPATAARLAALGLGSATPGAELRVAVRARGRIVGDVCKALRALPECGWSIGRPGPHGLTATMRYLPDGAPREQAVVVLVRIDLATLAVTTEAVPERVLQRRGPEVLSRVDEALAKVRVAVAAAVGPAPVVASVEPATAGRPRPGLRFAAERTGAAGAVAPLRVVAEPPARKDDPAFAGPATDEEDVADLTDGAIEETAEETAGDAMADVAGGAGSGA